VAEEVIPLVEETATVAKRDVVTGRVQVRTVTEAVEELARADLQHESVEVTRVPIDRVVETILDECVGHHPTYVFTYVIERSNGARARGGRRPITDGGFKTHWRRHVREAGIAPGFRRHDARHTAGTRYVRATGNLKGAQRLLGHSRVETTTRYAHVLLDDIRAGQEAVEAARYDASQAIEG
jgi:integrase